MTDRITVETTVDAPVGEAWDAFTSPERITQWNFASADWHCPAATVDLREGGKFSFRMEAKDGSAGFDFEGVYTKVIPNERVDYEFGGRHATAEFTPTGDRTRVRISFDPEDQHSLDQQRDGWNGILWNFAQHVGG